MASHDRPLAVPKPSLVDVSDMQHQVQTLKTENTGYQDQIGRQETELNKLRATIGSVREERDRFKRKVSGIK